MCRAPRRSQPRAPSAQPALGPVCPNAREPRRETRLAAPREGRRRRGRVAGPPRQRLSRRSVQLPRALCAPGRVVAPDWRIRYSGDRRADRTFRGPACPSLSAMQLRGVGAAGLGTLGAGWRTEGHPWGVLDMLGSSRERQCPLPAPLTSRSAAFWPPCPQDAKAGRPEAPAVYQGPSWHARSAPGATCQATDGKAAPGWGSPTQGMAGSGGPSPNP